MATPILQLLRAERNPTQLDMYCGTRTSELQSASTLADRFFDLHGLGTNSWIRLMEDRCGEYDLVVNLEATAMSKVAAWCLGSDGFVAGPCAGAGGRGDAPFPDDPRGELWRDKEWIAEDLTNRYPFLHSGFISEVFARLCYLNGPLPPYDVPKVLVTTAVPDVLVSASASLSDKLWPIEFWMETARELNRRGLSIGLLGAKRTVQGSYWTGADEEDRFVAEAPVEDLRGAFTLPQVVGALARAKVVLTLDNGILHLAACAGPPVVGLYRHGIHRLWAPPYPQVSVLTPGENASVRDISVRKVLEALDRGIG